MSAFNAATFFVDRHLEEGRGAHVAHRFDGRGVTWLEIAAASNRWANVLVELGVEPEQRVVLVLDDTPTFVAAFWGTVKVGAIVVPANPMMSVDDVAFVLADSRAKVAVVESRVAPKIAEVRAQCPHLRAIVDTHTFEERLARARPAFTSVETDEDEIMYWGYTSG